MKIVTAVGVEVEVYLEAGVFESISYEMLSSVSFPCTQLSSALPNL
jgi:hypothetical protein